MKLRICFANRSCVKGFNYELVYAVCFENGKEVNGTMTAMMETTMLDLDVDIDAMPAAAATPQITSVSLCTAFCTSQGGGSFCSFCC